MPIRILRVFLARARGAFSGAQADADLREELETHVALQAAEYERRGRPPEEARRAALVAAGGVTNAAEAHRAQRGLPFIERLAQDVRYGARMLRRGPLFAFVAIGAIALAVGINAGFFTLIDATMFEPLPVANPGRLMKLMSRDARHFDSIRFSYTDLEAIAAHASALEGLVGYYAAPIALRPTTGAHAATASAGCVSGNYFMSLGGRAAVGRTLLPADDEEGAAPVAVISDAFWTRAYARAPDVVGREIVIDGTRATIVGVAAADFRGVNPLVPDLWIPLTLGGRAGVTPGQLRNPANRFIVLHARLRPGVSAARAEAELSSILAEPPAAAGTPAELTRRTGGWLMPNEAMIPLTGETFLVAAPGFIIVLLVLVIACANLGNLLLSRALARHREIAVRLAIGASRGRIVRQLLTESLMIAIIGSAFGLLLSNWTVNVLMRSFLAAVPTTYGNVSLAFHTSWRVFAYTAGLTALSVLVFGLAPALQATATELTSALKGEDTLFGTRISRSRLRDTLVAVQVAACLVLLTAAATLVNSMRGIADVDTGLDGRGVTVAHLGLAGAGHTPPALADARLRFTQRVAAQPGVAAVALVSQPPWTAWPLVRVADASSRGDAHALYYDVVTPRYFDVVGQRLLAGRTFFESDSADGRVAIVSAAAARTLWPGRQPLGQLLRAGVGSDSTRVLRVVGVVADARSGMSWDNDANGYVYLPARTADLTSGDPSLLVRAARGADDPGRAIVDIATQVDPDAPLTMIRLPELLGQQVLPYRYAALVATGVGFFGLALAVMGLYGVVAFAVTQRRREIAIHIAMGAAPIDVLRLVMRGELGLVLRGILIGLALALGESKLLGSIVLPLAPVGAATIAALVAVLVFVAALATAAPALGALRLAPMRVLRQE